MTNIICPPLTAKAIEAQAATGGTPADMAIAMRDHACKMEADRARLLSALAELEMAITLVVAKGALCGMPDTRLQTWLAMNQARTVLCEVAS